MDFTNVPTPALIKVWFNLLEGLDKVHTTLVNGTFNTPPDTKGACPPSQAGQLTLWFAINVDKELTSRGITGKMRK